MGARGGGDDELRHRHRGPEGGALLQPVAQHGERRVAAGVVYTTFHHPSTQANVVTTDFSDWATNCPEFKVTAVQVSPSNGPSEWQESYNEQAERSRRILTAAE